MKRSPRDDTRFDLMRLIDASAKARGVSIRDESRDQEFLAGLMVERHPWFEAAQVYSIEDVAERLNTNPSAVV